MYRHAAIIGNLEPVKHDIKLRNRDKVKFVVHRTLLTKVQIAHFIEGPQCGTISLRKSRRPP